ncbi:MAG TPA: hypothetical protein VJR94_00945 [Candidatus Nitrosocosmicus sp.]|nr:hypothetical protein [Candidatus Nitrosocosmicus sp.]
MNSNNIPPLFSRYSQSNNSTVPLIPISKGNYQTLSDTNLKIEKLLEG